MARVGTAAVALAAEELWRKPARNPWSISEELPIGKLLQIFGLIVEIHVSGLHFQKCAHVQAVFCESKPTSVILEAGAE